MISPPLRGGVRRSQNSAMLPMKSNVGGKMDQIKTIGSRSPIHELDRPRTFGEAAENLGVPYTVVQRAARRGLVPTYRLGTSRPYVRLRDFVELMFRHKNS
jgi:hypothetical protein